MSSDIEAKLKDVPDKYLVIIARIVAGYENDTTSFENFNDPILSPSVRSVYMFFVIQYGILSLVGIVMNVAIIVYALMHRLYKDVTHAFIINLALCHFVQCALVLPISLMVMLLQNWIFGQFLCFFLPIMQDIPFHVAMISHLLIAWDRMRWLGDPLRGRLPAFVCCCASWLTGMVIALPYPIYTTYLDLGTYVSGLHGVGLCFVNLIDDMQEYMRGLFVIMYCAPTTILAYLYIRTSQELRPPVGPFAVMMFEHRADIRNRQRNSTTSSSTERPARQDSTRSYDLYNAELDVCREKRTQRHLGSMAATQVLCICPLMVLRLAKMVITETYENARHFDFTYLMFVWAAFLPTVIFPCIYACGILSRSEKERLRGYFRLSTRKRGGSKRPKDSQDESTIQENSTEILQSNRSNSIERLGAKKITEDDDPIEDTKILTNTKNPSIAPANRIARPTPRQANYFQSKKIVDSINNSCSNITSSTYCNNGTERGSIDTTVENASELSVGKDSLFESKWMNSALLHKDLTFSDCDSIVRNGSSSTLERDLEIIDLLERERSMDIQDMMEREKRGEIVRNVSLERRRLPDLGKICKSPKQQPDMHGYDNLFDYSQSLQYQHQNQQQQQQHHHRIPSRKSSHGSSERTMKRDSLVSGGSDIGIFSEPLTKTAVIENRIRRAKRNSSGSAGGSGGGGISSARSSLKSRDHIIPSIEVGFRENLFADL